MGAVIEDPRPRREVFRAIVGILAIVAGIAGLAGLYFIEVPEGNREPLLLGLGSILGWGAAVVNYEFGGSQAGRKAAEAGVRRGVL